MPPLSWVPKEKKEGKILVRKKTRVIREKSRNLKSFLKKKKNLRKNFS